MAKAKKPKDWNIYECPIKSIKVGPYDYEIRWMDEADFSARQAHGQHESDYHVIYAVSTINKWHMMDTLKHELNHSIESLFGLNEEVPKGEDETDTIKFHTDEHHCTILASGWVMIERDNPEFRNWFNSLYDLIEDSNNEPNDEN